MVFRKTIKHFCILASEMLLTNAAFYKGGPAKTLEDIFEGYRPQSPFCDQYNLLSYASNKQHTGKQPNIESYNNLLTKNTDLTPPAMSNNRNFEESFENGESMRMKLADSEKELDLWTPFSGDWGEDFMFSNSEWDEVLNHTKESQLAEIKYDFANTLEGAEYSYHDYNRDNIFLCEKNLGLIPRPESSGTLSGVSLNGAVETQFPAQQNLVESSFTVNPPLKSLNRSGPTLGLAENIYTNVLDKAFSFNQQEEARDLHLEGQDSNGIFESPSSLHLNQDSNSSRKTITGNPRKKKKYEAVELPIFKKKKQQSKELYLEKKNKVNDKILLQRDRFSSNNIAQQPQLSLEDAKEQLKIKNKTNKKISQLKKHLKDVIDDVKLNLKHRNVVNTKKSTFGLLLETMDNFADNISTENGLGNIMEIKQEDLSIYIKKPFIKPFLGGSEFLLCQSLFEKLHEAFKQHSKEESKDSNQEFFKLIYDQIKRNNGITFYIKSHQVDLFFNLKAFNFKVKNSAWQKIYLNNSWIGKYIPEYGTLPTQRFDLRKLFLAYTSLINKILCSGENDLINHFSDRQKAAINFFDEFISCLEIDEIDSGTYFIKNEKLPLDENLKKIFLENPGLTYSINEFQLRIVNGNRNKIGILWRIIALWLAKDKYDYFIAIYCPKNDVLSCFKNFVNSLFFFILES
ncbi:expressed protein [Phakopsora pachyrhizi]|uniref:Expressed protein n=1 Tax=Phakopsora pachyrhizi TaxID=170000 RepID=A0AAV0AN98_PHAPC|nr:expressed protein [Phakopsora pachyrhizi]